MVSGVPNTENADKPQSAGLDSLDEQLISQW
jgi:hypothetical protein